MSYWPDFLPPPDTTALLQLRGPEDEALFGLGDTGWPSLKIPALLPLHIVKVCAIGIHRDEARLSDRARNDSDFLYHCPGFEFSGYPKAMTFAQAASVPIGALAAYQALFSYPLLREPGPKDWGAKGFDARGNGRKRMLITGAATPVGVWAVQFAKLAGAGEITATCDAGSMGLVEGLGASRVLDWASGEGRLERGWKGGRGFDVVLDCVGRGTLERAWTLVAEAGRILSVAEDALAVRPKGARGSAIGFGFRLENSPKQLGIVAALAEREGGGVRAVCEPRDVFLLTDFEKAMERLRESPRGQVVVQMEPDPEVPVEVIKVLERYGEGWGTVNDFGTSRIQMAGREDAGEQFCLAGWLRTEGSNQPGEGKDEEP
ncbi:hypothetical protein C8A05DRAFT_14705 [Staphylotrichum tortipilum]|uniref:Enoyl reductase (ER) domain-containing protein n=1 Tax=Staphylotrichum tortipilum TaxID=2831512 RepID=A0AAN6MN63_9PEZI|nr:hypothetical protein C8A05DRAFT_14705 [Staphylotrichum longicolle]